MKEINRLDGIIELIKCLIFLIVGFYVGYFEGKRAKEKKK